MFDASHLSGQGVLAARPRRSSAQGLLDLHASGWATTRLDPGLVGSRAELGRPRCHVDRTGGLPPRVGCPSRIRTSVHGSKVRCPTTRRRGSGPRRRDWSGRRDSNPRPSPWQGDALPTEPLPPEQIRPPVGGAESQIRTGDTAIFSRVLYQLSYLGPMVNQPSAARRRVEDSTGLATASNRGGRPHGRRATARSRPRRRMGR